MYKKLLFVLIVCFTVIPRNLYAQNIRYDFNKIEKREHLNLFYNKLNKKQETIKILHLGDSHIMMGHFSNEIRRILDSAYGIISYGWAFPNQIGKYNTLYTNSKLNSGKRSFFNNPNAKVINDRSYIYLMPHICFDLDHMIDFDFLEFLVINKKLKTKVLYETRRSY